MCFTQDQAYRGNAIAASFLSRTLTHQSQINTEIYSCKKNCEHIFFND